MKFIYPAIIHEDIDGYWAEFIDLEGCSTQGDTLEELLENATEALEVYLLGLLEDGIKLPTPSSITNQKHLEENCFTTLISTEVDLSKNIKSIKKTLTIPAWLNEKALDKRINFSSVLQKALIQELGLR